MDQIFNCLGDINMNYQLTELAYLRNQLATGNFSIEDVQLIKKIKQHISELDTPFKELALNAINNCEQDIENGNFKLATQEIQLIHNLPFEKSEIWNADYFYKIELLSYLEQVEEPKKIKKLIQLLALLDDKLNPC